MSLEARLIALVQAIGLDVKALFTRTKTAEDKLAGLDTANGVAYLNGANQLVSGSALTFDGTNFGVGTASPSYKLEVYDATNPRLSLNTGASGTSELRFSTPSSGYQGLITYSAASNFMAFYTSASEQMRLTSAGLGIGTSSPASKLHVDGGSLAPASGSVARFDTTATTAYNGGGFVGGQLRLNYGNATSSYSGINFSNFGATSQEFFGVVQNSAGQGSFVWQGFSGASYAERMRLDSSGNLGLGVTPSAWLAGFKIFEFGGGGAVGGFTDNSLNLYSNSFLNNSPIENRYVASGYAALYKIGGASGAHAWFNAPTGTAGNPISFTQAMTLDADGNLMVGTTSVVSNPNQGVVVYAPSSGGTAIYTGHGSGTVTGTGYLNFNYDAVTIGSITQNGTTGVAYNTTSDYRLKTVIGAVSGHGERIDALNPVDYQWKADGTAARGFLAHQFQGVYPSSVTGSKDAVDAEGKPIFQAMQASSSEVIADLVAEIQSIRARIAAAGI